MLSTRRYIDTTHLYAPIIIIPSGIKFTFYQTYLNFQYAKFVDDNFHFPHLHSCLFFLYATY